MTQNVHNARRNVKAKRTSLSCFLHTMDYDDRPDTAKRLELARIKRGFDDAKKAATFFGWKYDTYIQHENGTRGIHRAVDKYAKAYRVTAGWLLTGEGTGPTDGRPATEVGVYGYVGAGAEISPYNDFEHEPLEVVEIDFPVKPGTGGVIVRGDSQMPIFEDGDLVGYHQDGQDPYSLLGRMCVVRLNDGRMFIKRLARGSSDGFFTLVSSNARDIEDVVVDWASPYRFKIPREEWRNM
ncbi:XRE family transcriptional regulator [Agrobacterium sp. Ap1]|uniref:S24 family peptidase n=1 Tax=Agrobacterium sp. Ap1 TaxID=2815337 RepID=UPI001A8E6D05|nr:S24 family peptidase [Agrobacterium sp. Ap1]MBO0142285.1 XRE family transcriptional regulator [Agrobacterium sp. Ap1]